MLLNPAHILICTLAFVSCFAEPEVEVEVISKPDDCDKVTQEKDLLYIHYTSYFGNGSKIESSYEKGQPAYLPLGRGKIISGLEEALLDMCVGEVRKIVIPAHLAYGEKGYNTGGVKIPPNETIIFEAELVLFNDASAIEEAFLALDADGNNKLDEDELRIMMQSFRYIPKNVFPKEFDEDKLEEMFNTMIEQSDLNKDSYISYDEFLTVTALKDPPKGDATSGNTKDVPKEEDGGQPVQDNMKKMEL